MNIEAFENLIDKYESIDLVDIEEEWDEEYFNEGHYVMRELTGFGGCSSCSLCQAVGTTGGGHSWKTSCNCQNCMYYLVNPNGEYPPCVDETYEAIVNAETPEQLYNAIQDRIKYMKAILKNYNVITE